MFGRKRNKEHLTKKIDINQPNDDVLNSDNPLFKTVFDSMFDGVVVQDKDGKIIASNQAARTILKLPDESLKGKTSLSHVWHNIHEDGTDFPGETHPTMVAIKTKKAVENVIMGLRTPSIKETTWLRVNARPILADGELVYVVATFSDITGEKTKSIEIDNLYSNSIDLLGIANVNGHFEQVNSAVKTILGYSAEEFILKPFLSYIHPADIESTKAQLGKLSRGQNIPDFINRYRHKDGHYISIQWNASQIGTKLYCIGRDITTQLEQQQTDQLFRSALENSVDAIYSIDLKGTITSWNRAAHKLYGYTEREILGQSVSKLVPKDHNDHKQILKRFIKEKR